MRKTHIKTILESCTHTFIQSNGFMVCTQCGHVLEDMVFSPLPAKSDPDKARLKFNRMKLNGRLAKLNSFSLKDTTKEARIEKTLVNKCNKLNLPYHIKKDAKNKLKMVFKTTKISNSITCIAAIIWATCKAQKYPLSLNYLLEFFQGDGHRINPHLFAKAIMKYQPFISSPCPNNIPLTYLPKMISQLREHKDIIQQRFILKQITYYPDIESFLLDLEKLSRKIITTLNPKMKKYSVNPLNYTASVIYLAGELIAIKLECTQYLIPQSILSKITGISDYSIRFVYNNYLKQYNPRKNNNNKEVKTMQLLRIDHMEDIPEEKIEKLVQYLLQEKIKFQIFELESLKK